MRKSNNALRFPAEDAGGERVAGSASDARALVRRLKKAYAEQEGNPTAPEAADVPEAAGPKEAPAVVEVLQIPEARQVSEVPELPKAEEAAAVAEAPEVADAQTTPDAPKARKARKTAKSAKTAKAPKTLKVPRSRRAAAALKAFKAPKAPDTPEAPAGPKAPEAPKVSEAAEPAPAPVARPALSPLAKRILKSFAAVVVVAIVGFNPIRTMLLSTSVEAVVNARLVSVRAPLDGRLDTDLLPAIGTPVAAGQVLGTVVNARVDAGRMTSLQRSLAEARAAYDVEARKIAAYEHMTGEISRQLDAFVAGRTAMLEQRSAEIEAEIASGEARVAVQEGVLRRSGTLHKTGSVSDASHEAARRDLEVSRQAVLAARARLAANETELAALRKRSFIGDSYNDRPNSAQTLTELERTLIELRAAHALKATEIAQLETALAEESAHVARLSRAEVRIPVAGRVWDVKSAPGEEIGRGEDVLRVLDCTGAVVTASVSEEVYNSLSIGSAATFRFRRSTETFEGRVISVMGIAGAGANLAIQPSALTVEPYRVTVAVPQLAAGESCEIGRTGRVVFNADPGRTFFGRLFAWLG